MQPLYAYLLKLSLCLALGYLFYYVLLRRMTYYNWNRYFLLLFPMFSLLIPVIHFPANETTPALGAVFYITNVLPSNSEKIVNDSSAFLSRWSILQMVIAFIVAGSVFFFARFAIRFYSLKRTRNRAELLHDGEIKLYQLPGTKSPFSFNNSIYLDSSLYNEQDLQNIIAHEMVHVTGKHTTDMMISEMLCIIQWFNPFAWLMKHAIRQNLEFIADEQVLQKGINRKGYQYLLLKVSGAIPHSLANNLLFPSLKKRIHMMNRTKTTKVHLLKFMCIVPLACLLLVAFSGPAVNPSGPRMISDPETFGLASLSFYINDVSIATIVKKEQGKSFLKAGGPLSLSLISEEKARLTALLQKNGYDNINAHAITFVMDTSVTTKTFSVQVTIQLDRGKAIGAANQRPSIPVSDPQMEKREEDPVQVQVRQNEKQAPDRHSDIK